MSENSNQSSYSADFILRALVGWAVSVLILLPLASLAVWKTDIPASSLGYISSGLSFLCAFFAGMYAAKTENKGIIYKALISSSVITVLLLTAGFLKEGSNLKASAVLSLVSFTFSGCLLGAVMFPKEKKKRSGNKIHHKR